MAGLSPLAGVFVPGAAMLQMPPVLGASQAVALPETDLFGALPGDLDAFVHAQLEKM